MLPNPTLNHDIHHHFSGAGLHRDGVSTQKRRPNGDVFVGLIGRREGSGERDFPVPVHGVDVEAVVGNAAVTVRDLGGEGDGDIGSEKFSGAGAGGEGEIVECGVSEEEAGLEEEQSAVIETLLREILHLAGACGGGSEEVLVAELKIEDYGLEFGNIGITKRFSNIYRWY
nr:hypothetical protein Csa_6G454480 [Ipomoea batatas]